MPSRPGRTGASHVEAVCRVRLRPSHAFRPSSRFGSGRSAPRPHGTVSHTELSSTRHSHTELSSTTRVHMTLRHTQARPDRNGQRTNSRHNCVFHTPHLQTELSSASHVDRIPHTFTSRRRQHVVWNPRMTLPGCHVVWNPRMACPGCRLVTPDEWDRVMCPSDGAPDEGLTLAGYCSRQGFGLPQIADALQR